MRIVANAANGLYLGDLIEVVKRDIGHLEQIDLAVAYAQKMDSIFALADDAKVPLTLYTLMDGKFPHIDLATRFVENDRMAWRLFLTRDFFHAKIMWFRGVGAYVGSANLTDKAWASGLECGIWFSQAELEASGWVTDFVSILTFVRGRCVPATPLHIGMLETLREMRKESDRANQAFQKELGKILKDVPGGKAPSDHTTPTETGGAAKKAFLAEWNEGLDILRKLAKQFEAKKASWPAWVSRETHPAIVQDQATEWWWHTEFRESGESLRLLQQVNKKNAGNPDVAAAELIANWCKFDGGAVGGAWHEHMNENPAELHQLLTIESIADMTSKKLARIICLCHSAKAHARQMDKKYFGLSPGIEMTIEECCEKFSQYLWGQRTEEGKNVSEVLEFVLWGDRVGSNREADGALRIWLARSSDKWYLPHLGVNILGELDGYARPDEFPPRNNRVSKTLFGLGFSDITYS